MTKNNLTNKQKMYFIFKFTVSGDRNKAAFLLNWWEHKRIAITKQVYACLVQLPNSLQSHLEWQFYPLPGHVLLNRIWGEMIEEIHLSNLLAIDLKKAWCIQFVCRVLILINNRRYTCAVCNSCNLKITRICKLIYDQPNETNLHISLNTLCSNNKVTCLH